MNSPGRSCPVDYRYRPRDLATLEQTAIADPVYIVGGLYGNSLALDQIIKLKELEPGANFIFNGDFNWFNKSSEQFKRINQEVLKHHALAGNVEKELTRHNDINGCGCAYPDWVDNGTVTRSNQIIKQLKHTASSHSDILSQLQSLPLTMRINLNGTRILILHGDPESLSGWGLSYEMMKMPAHQDQLKSWFTQTEVDVICCTHTCLTAIKSLKIDGETKIIINNGSAGMGNFKNQSYGLIIRIAESPCHNHINSIWQLTYSNVFIDLVKVNFDNTVWQQTFLQQWPEGSPAHLSYYHRIQHGTELTPEELIL